MRIEGFVFPEGDLIVVEVSLSQLPLGAMRKEFATCGDCTEMDTCPKLSMVTEKAINYLKPN